MKRLGLLLLSFTLIIQACDVIDEPIIPVTTNYNEALYGPAPTFGPPSTTLKNALLEDFTAHQCGNCPDAGVIAGNIISNNPGRAVLVAIHAGSLAAFNAAPPFNTDWTTPEGNVFFEQLDFQANPLGRINRSGGAGNFYQPSQWSAQVSQQLSQSAAVNLQIIAEAVPENDHVNIHVHGTFAANYPNSTNLVVLITESNLVDYQLWYGQSPSTIPDYNHKHVLRTSVTGPLGLQFSPTNASSGSEFRRDYTFTWSDAWVMEHSHVVAFVYDNVTGEVLNVIEADL